MAHAVLRRGTLLLDENSACERLYIVQVGGRPDRLTLQLKANPNTAALSSRSGPRHRQPRGLARPFADRRFTVATWHGIARCDWCTLNGQEGAVCLRATDTIADGEPFVHVAELGKPPSALKPIPPRGTRAELRAALLCIAVRRRVRCVVMYTLHAACCMLHATRRRRTRRGIRRRVLPAGTARTLCRVLRRRANGAPPPVGFPY